MDYPTQQEPSLHLHQTTKVNELFSHFVIISRKVENVLSFFFLLPPATKLGQGYVFTCVCDSVILGGEGVVSQHALQVVSQHALLVSSHTQGEAEGVWPGGGSPGPHPGRSPGPHPGGVCIPACTEADPPMATAVGSMHPTGMHSCFMKFDK